MCKTLSGSCSLVTHMKVGSKRRVMLPHSSRFSALKDILVVLRLRYMSSLYYLSCVGFVIQFGLWAYHKPEVVVHIPNETVADACAQLWAELRGLLPLFLVMVGSFLMRRDKSVYLLDFALFEPPADWCLTRENIMTILKNAGKIAGSFHAQRLCHKDQFCPKRLHRLPTLER